MAISKVQNQQIAFTQRPLVEKSGNVAMERFLTLPREHYRNVDDIPDTVNNIRPEKGQGRLVNNGVFSSIPRFFAICTVAEQCGPAFGCCGTQKS